MESEKRELMNEQDIEYLQSYFEFMPIGGTQVIAASAAVIVVGIAWYFFCYRKNAENNNDEYGREQDNNDKMLDEGSSETYHTLRELLRQDEEEENLAFRRFMAEKSRKNTGNGMDWIEIEEQDKRNMQKKQKESDERLQKLKDQNRIDQLVRDRIANFEIEQLKNHGRSHLEQLRSESERSQEHHLKNAAEQQKQFKNQQETMKREIAERQQESIENDEKAKERRRELEKQLERNLDELRTKFEQRKREMDVQLFEIQNILRMNLWNSAIENNWTNRLNSLRSSNEEVRNVYFRMKNYSKQDLKMVLTTVEKQKSLMETEKNEMQKLYNETGKQFLLDIKDAAEDVVSECNRLIYVLKNEPSNIERIEDCFSALSKVSMAIPTLAELKQRNRESMRE